MPARSPRGTWMETQKTWRGEAVRGRTESGTSGSGTSPRRPRATALERAVTGTVSSRSTLTAPLRSFAPPGPRRLPGTGLTAGPPSTTSWKEARPPRGATSSGFQVATEVAAWSFT